MKLNYKRTFLVGLAFMSISAFWQLYDSIIPLMLKNTFGLGDTLAGGIMALDNILALFLLPLFGTLSDRVDTPIGKRMPFVLVGTGVTVLAMVCLPIADNLTNLPFHECFVCYPVGSQRVPLASGSINARCYAAGAAI